MLRNSSVIEASVQGSFSGRSPRTESTLGGIDLNGLAVCAQRVSAGADSRESIGGETAIHFHKNSRVIGWLMKIETDQGMQVLLLTQEILE